MKTNSKQVREKIIDHIESYIDPKEYDCETVKQALSKQINFMKNKNESVYSVAYRFVESGSFIVYTGDAVDFLNTLDLNNNSRKKFNDDDSWKLYCYLIAREIERIITRE